MIEISKIKSSLLEIVEKYSNKGILNNSFKAEFEALFDKSTLRIGVIGKMKAGKSSLVNALLFCDRILPVGDKPVTVTLTEITYDVKDGVEVEFMTEDDIASLRKLVSFGANDAKTSAAKDLLATIDNIQGGYSQYISKGKVNISLSELQEYAAADGKLSGLTKYVKIKLNNKNLQGISIVDTPGFNDPIESRGETTKSSIKECQILLFVHDFYDRYDEEEVAMATHQIEYAGVSEVIDIVNKTDQESDATLEDWDYLAQDYKNNRSEVLSTASPILRELIGNSPVICVSALMSLLGKIEDSQYDDFDIRKYNDFRERYKELESKEKFHLFSNIPLVENEINRITRNSSRYLIETPLLKLVGELETASLLLKSDIDKKQGNFDMLNIDSSRYNTDVDEINKLIKCLLETFQNTDPLYVDFLKAVNAARDKIFYKRSETISNEFLDENFPEPSPLTAGIKKQNLGNYCTILLQMDGKIRVELDGLKKELVSINNLYIDNLVAETLTKTHVKVTDVNRKKVELTLKPIAEKAIYMMNLSVETERPTSFPIGKLSQKSRHLNKFQSAYEDSRINEDFIFKFESCIKFIVDDFKKNGEICLAELSNELIKGLDYTPEEKDKKMKLLKDELSSLMSKKDNVDAVCASLRNISKVEQKIDSQQQNTDSDVIHKELSKIETKLKEYENVGSN